MSRVVWFAAGAGLGVYAMTKARRVAEALTPEGLADRLAGLSVAARLFRDEVETGMSEKEKDLRERLGLTLHGHPAELSGGSGPGAPAPPDRSENQREGND